jgi:hypothetical protein
MENKMKYYSLKYTDDMKEGTGGYAKGWFIRLRPKYREDKGILEHEKCHVRQWFFTFMLHGPLYLFFKPYRLRAEVQAYKEQLDWPPALLDRKKYLDKYAEFISTKYKLDITKEEAKKRLEAVK